MHMLNIKGLHSNSARQMVQYRLLLVRSGLTDSDRANSGTSFAHPAARNQRHSVKLYFLLIQVSSFVNFTM